MVTGKGRAFCAGMDFGDRGETFSSSVSLDEYRGSGGQVSLVVNNLKANSDCSCSLF
ncbi:hypothetical protein [Bacillus sp. 1P10SD]|uniref:hypothetical protein n=1 Tax=Bacillus sp. 1P10SD TaxID=3132265 RepID=UPI0039A693C7